MEKVACYPTFSISTLKNLIVQGKQTKKIFFSGCLIFLIKSGAINILTLYYCCSSLFTLHYFPAPHLTLFQPHCLALSYLPSPRLSITQLYCLNKCYCNYHPLDFTIIAPISSPSFLSAAIPFIQHYHSSHLSSSIDV